MKNLLFSSFLALLLLSSCEKDEVNQITPITKDTVLTDSFYVEYTAKYSTYITITQNKKVIFDDNKSTFNLKFKFNMKKDTIHVKIKPGYFHPYTSKLAIKFIDDKYKHLSDSFEVQRYDAILYPN
jgi:hypothetical protein